MSKCGPADPIMLSYLGLVDPNVSSQLILVKLKMIKSFACFCLQMLLFLVLYKI